jgi:hypothetical protein
MATATRNRTRHQVYSHPSSVAARAPEKHDPVAALRATHHAEMTELGTRHRRESVDLERAFNAEEAKHPDSRLANRPADEGKRRKALQQKHSTERAKMVARHGAEIEAESKRHPVE